MRRAFASLLGLLVLCSCATREKSAATVRALPAPVPINHGAGRGDYLFVTVHLEDGEDLPFVIDTGSSATLFDNVMAPQLGRSYGQSSLTRFGVDTKSSIFVRPRFYLGGAPLEFGGKYVGIYNFKRESVSSGHTIMGVLGMDCLANYIIQLDFDTGTMRFLDRAELDPAALGQAFKLSPFQGRAQLRGGALLGGGNDALIDTGTKVDGALKTELFMQAIREKQLHPNENISTNQVPHYAALPQCTWNGNSYTDLILASVHGENLLGLRFLARHLVTLDFPRGTMYLKQLTPGPLPR
jgi:hypothetical protein